MNLLLGNPFIKSLAIDSQGDSGILTVVIIREGVDLMVCCVDMEYIA